MINIYAIGNLTRDPEKTDKGCRLSVACNAPDDTVDYLTVYVYGKLAESVISNLHKGDKVGVNGRMHCNIRENDDNVYLNENVYAYTIEYLVRRNPPEQESKKQENQEPKQKKYYRS